MLSDANATMLARLGFAARGLVYLLIGWFAITAAMGGGQTADNQGAIASLARQPFGQVLLAIVAAGLLGYAVWRLTEAVADPERIAHDGKGNLKRAAHAISGIAHVILAWTAAKLALDLGASGGQSPGDESARDWTAWLLTQPLGRFLVAAVAIGLLVAAFQQFKKAYKGDFITELRGDAPAPGYVCTMGRIGYGARGLVFLIIAGFFTIAAWQSRASEAGGMADALTALESQPGGKWLLAATGIGLALFGVYSFIEARFRRIRVNLPG
ncbi:DUF1206 domain-containing protein [Sphingomonas qomolangmaensis]|uniref:DUF1206 domain-containing protein n=1 Tax=Sphingomonas qomolangmaensis TaxID=2918765 RepID=A0ABY5LBZ1_9SPHN|nr:DUF1206 domain-containing protein [Sphingomonas qomolangmaensis]UUL83932.1 DUF1206 domain-containing protein [Sphingomonas qomolangmaensis]